jgi:hypothetical protein
MKLSLMQWSEWMEKVRTPASPADEVTISLLSTLSAPLPSPLLSSALLNIVWV